MKLPRRQFLRLAGGAAALPAVLRIARAQAYPSRPIRLGQRLRKQHEMIWLFRPQILPSAIFMFASPKCAR